MTFSDLVITLAWGQIFKMTFECQIIVDSTRLNMRNTMLAKWMSCFFWVKSYYKNIFSKKRLFLEFLLSGGQTVDLWWNLSTRLRKNVKRAIECAFLRRTSSSGFRVMCRFVEKCWKRQNLTFGDFRWPDLWPDLKMIKAVSSWFFTLFQMPLTTCRCMSQKPS